MTTVADVDKPPVAAGAPWRWARHSAGRPWLRATAVPTILALLPFLVPAIAIAARRPHIVWADDRALTELAVREAARGHQLLGIGGRFGWRHPGPLWIYLLVPFYELSGHAPWALSIGAVAVHVAMVAVAVGVAGRFGGARAAAVLGALVVLYTASTGMGFWTNLWAGYAFTWPVLAMVVLAAVVASDGRAGWALPAAALVASLLVQTDVSTAVPVAFVLGGAVALRWIRLGGLRLGGEPNGRHASPTRVTPLAGFLLALAVAVWIPPLIEEARGHPGNLTLLARFALKAAGGYPLRTALAAVGAALSVLPLGPRWVLSDHFQEHLGPGPWWAVGVTLGAATVLAVTAVSAWHRRRRLAGDLAAVTLLGLIAGVVAVARVDGPINFYLLTWVTVLPVSGLAAVVLAFAPASGRRGWRMRIGDAYGDPVTWLATALAALLAAVLVVTQGTTHNWDRTGAAQVATETQRAAAYLGPAATGLVQIHILTPITWRLAAGVALQLERAGARIEVDRNWVFLFGDAFAPRPGTPSAELWFAHAGEVPVVAGARGVVYLGGVQGVYVLARIR